MASVRDKEHAYQQSIKHQEERVSLTEENKAQKKKMVRQAKIEKEPKINDKSG